MTKRILALIFLFLFLTPHLFASNNSWEYLGKTSSDHYCKSRAERKGYDDHRYGGEVDNYFQKDACFGKKKYDTGGDELNHFDLDIYQGESSRDCIQKVEREVRGIQCKNGHRNQQVICSTSSNDRWIKDDMEFLRCVNKVWGPFSNLLGK